MVLAVDKADVVKTMEAIQAAGEQPYEIGYVEAADKGVKLI
jgi:phosphoribosylformylglycinamidine cyclo-ligase